MKRNLMAFTAAALAVTPMMAAPALAAPTSNPAASLSVAKARAGAPGANKSGLAGITGGGSGGIIAALIVAGVVAIGVVAAVNGGDDNNNSDSN